MATAIPARQLPAPLLTLSEAADLAQNRPLWRMMSTYGAATQSLELHARKDDDPVCRQAREHSGCKCTFQVPRQLIAATIIYIFIHHQDRASTQQRRRAILIQKLCSSVCLSVYHAPVLYRNGLKYQHTFFSVSQPHHSNFPSIQHLCEIPTE